MSPFYTIKAAQLYFKLRSFCGTDKKITASSQRRLLTLNRFAYASGSSAGASEAPC